MNVKVEVQKEEAWRRVLAIELSAEDAEKEYDKVARRVAKSIKLPGFRKGKVPAALVKKTYKTELDQEFLETVVPRALGEALDQTGLDPVTEPKFEDLSYGSERPLSFTADFECRPDIELNAIRGIAIDKEVREVTDEDIDEVLENFRKSRATLEEVERPAIDGDVLVVDYRAVDENDKPIPGREVKGYEVELGSGRVIEAFDEALKGAEPGNVRDAEVPYPEDYADEILAGTTARFKIKVAKVQEKRYPDLDDALVGANTDLSTVDELKEKVREDLAKERDREANDQLEGQLLEKAVDAHPFDPPAALVDNLLEDFVRRQQQEMAQQGQDPESFNADEAKTAHREGAEREVRRSLLIDAIAKQEEISVEVKELQERVGALAYMQRTTPKKLIEQMGGDSFLRGISRRIRDKKVLAFLRENAEITEKKAAS